MTPGPGPHAFRRGARPPREAQGWTPVADAAGDAVDCAAPERSPTHRKRERLPDPRVRERESGTKPRRNRACFAEPVVESRNSIGPLGCDVRSLRGSRPFQLLLDRLQHSLVPLAQDNALDQLLQGLG